MPFHWKYWVYRNRGILDTTLRWIQRLGENEPKIPRTISDKLKCFGRLNSMNHNFHKGEFEDLSFFYKLLSKFTFTIPITKLFPYVINTLWKVAGKFLRTNEPVSEPACRECPASAGWGCCAPRPASGACSASCSGGWARWWRGRRRPRPGPSRTGGSARAAAEWARWRGSPGDIITCYLTKTSIHHHLIQMQYSPLETTWCGIRHRGLWRFEFRESFHAWQIAKTFHIISEQNPGRSLTISKLEGMVGSLNWKL